MKRPIMREKARGRWIFGSLIVLCALLDTRCSVIGQRAAAEEWHPPRVVQVKGLEILCNYPPTWCIKVGPNRPAGIFARDGDLFYVTKPKEHLFPYRGSDGDSLVLEEKDGVLFLNGKAVSVDTNRATSWEWLRNASSEDISGLRLLMIGRQTDDLDFPLLEKVARASSNVGLFLGIDQADIAERVISLFEPDFLAIDPKVLSARFDALEPRLAKLEVLWAPEQGPLDFLPRLPRLHTLWVKWRPAGLGGIPGNRNLRSVAIMEGNEIEDLSFLRNLSGLEELTLWGVKVKDITALASVPDLKKLVLFFDNSNNPVDTSVLDRLPKLTWLGFPGNTTQEAFANIIASHPDLEVVELPGSDNIRDLSPLLTLRHLKATIVPLKNVDVGALQELKSLRYLALVHKDALEGDAAEKFATLEQALPGTFVTQAAPFCLGSGWILLLVPAVLLFLGLWSRKHGRRCEAHA